MKIMVLRVRGSQPAQPGDPDPYFESQKCPDLATADFIKNQTVFTTAIEELGAPEFF